MLFYCQVITLFQYSQLIDEFKEMHKEAEALKTSGFNTADIKKDITSMEDEKEQLLKRIDRLKKKVFNSESNNYNNNNNNNVDSTATRRPFKGTVQKNLENRKDHYC